MSAARWVDQESVEPAYYDDRRSVDLIGTEEIPTTSGFNVGVAYYTAEEFGEPQVHEDQEAIYVVAGVGEIKVGEDIVVLTPGIAVYVPPQTPHGGRRTGDEPVMVVYAHGAV